MLVLKVTALSQQSVELQGCMQAVVSNVMDRLSSFELISKSLGREEVQGLLSLERDTMAQLLFW